VINKLFRSSSLLLAACVIASCSDSALRSPTSPTDSVPVQTAQASAKIGGLLDVDHLQLRALWWKKKHQDIVPVSKQIGPAGGTITIPETGLTIVFPKNALPSPLTITVTSDDRYVAYKMEPAGTIFSEDVTVTQLLSFTELAGNPLRTQLFAAYIGDDSAKLSGKLPVLEIEPSHTVLSLLTGLPEAQVWVIRHFSRYMLASG
jgi:hypothetical protein